MYGGFAVPMPDGDAGTHITLSRMVQLAHAGSMHPAVRRVATGIVRGIPGTAGPLHARLIRDWVEERTLFVPDPYGTELLHDPPGLLAHILTEGIAQVDCDDIALLAATLGRSIGLRSRFVAVGFSPQSPYRHVWAELIDAQGRGPWVPVDPTRALQGLGGLRIVRRKIVEV